jgi:hypothetical protein
MAWEYLLTLTILSLGFESIDKCSRCTVLIHVAVATTMTVTSTMASLSMASSIAIIAGMATLFVARVVLGLPHYIIQILSVQNYCTASQEMGFMPLDNNNVKFSLRGKW